MNKEKTQEYGTVNQSYSLTLRYSRDTRKDGIVSKETIERKADLDIEPFPDPLHPGLPEGSQRHPEGDQGRAGGGAVRGDGAQRFCLRGRA